MDQNNNTTQAPTPSTTPSPSKNSLGSKIKKNQTPLLIILLTVLTGFLVVIAIAPKNKLIPPSQVNKAPAVPAETTLAFANASSSGAVQNLDIVTNTGTNKVTGVQLELSFDPKLVTNVTITPGNFIQNPVELLKKIDYTNGTITYVLGIPIGGAGISGTGTLAHLTFTEAGAAGQTVAINFLPKTLVSTEGLSTSSLKSTSNFTTTIGSNPTSAPSATASGQ